MGERAGAWGIGAPERSLPPFICFSLDLSFVAVVLICHSPGTKVTARLEFCTSVRKQAQSRNVDGFLRG